MRRHAFVVMPFGKKPIDHLGIEPSDKEELMIDFDHVYEELLCPALIKAGCDVQRADNDSVAGDIRTQVLFELITADIVIADVSTSNPNVFYELGLAHALGKDAFLLKQRDRKLPADFGGAHYHEYDLQSLNRARKWLSAELVSWAKKNRSAEVKTIRTQKRRMR